MERYACGGRCRPSRCPPAIQWAARPAWCRSAVRRRPTSTAHCAAAVDTCSRLASLHQAIPFGEGLDLVQRLEVLERLGDARAGLVLLPLEEVGERPPRVRHVSEVRRLLERAPRGIAIGHQHACVIEKEHLRIFLTAAGLVLEQHDRLGASFGAAVAPHITFALRSLARSCSHYWFEVMLRRWKSPNPNSNRSNIACRANEAM